MIHLHGVDFEVNLVPAKLTTMNMGESLWDQQLIQIQDELPQERQQQVFIHELVHCLLDGEEDGKEIDEAFVRRLGNSLWAALNDNDLLDATWWQRVLAPPLEPVNPIPLTSVGKAPR